MMLAAGDSTIPREPMSRRSFPSPVTIAVPSPYPRRHVVLDIALGHGTDSES